MCQSMWCRRSGRAAIAMITWEGSAESTSSLDRSTRGALPLRAAFSIVNIASLHSHLKLLLRSAYVLHYQAILRRRRPYFSATDFLPGQKRTRWSIDQE